MDNYTGKRLDGRYEIQEVIGVGGMAVVYRAYDNIEDKIVAIKILKDEFLANEEFRRRFKNESKAISLLSHPNIVKVFNVNYGDRLQYIVMEYVEGITLKEYIEQQGHLGIKETVHFTMQILRALQHAHDKGIIHRDIKPQNILLLSNGTIKVTDFGIARFSYSDTKTMTDSAIGSVHYISPEQARGLSIDERTDIYSIGVVMYEMLTGRLPFVSDNSVSVALMQLQNDPRSIREINPNIPAGLEQIVMRAMEKSAKSRYQTASEMLLDIEEFKRNPNMRFQQPGYYVDSEPTRISNGGGTFVAPPVKQTPAPPKPVVEEDDDDYDYEGANKGKAGFVIAGVLIGLIVVAVVGFTAAYIFGQNNPTVQKVFSHFSFLQTEKVTVPDMTGKVYSQSLVDKEEYKDLKFEVKAAENASDEDEGKIVDQDPQPGEYFQGNNRTVVLYVAGYGAKDLVVPDIVGMNWSSAEDLLKNQGLKVDLIDEANLTVEYGTVIRTTPKAGEAVSKGDTIHVYYASDDSYIEVPNVVGMKLASAEEMLESMNLGVDASYESVNSDRPEGEIVSQTETAGTKVAPGTKLHLQVSNGIPELNSLFLKITLPSTNIEQTCVIYVDGVSKYRDTILMDGSVHSFTIEGEGEEASLKVRINSNDYYSCTVDFTRDDPVISDARYASTGTSNPPLALINVVGDSVLTAKEKLSNRGFENVTVEYITVEDSSQNGMVILMQPMPSSSSPVTADTEIILTVGQYEGV